MTKKGTKPTGRKEAEIPELNNADLIPILNKGYDSLDKSLNALINAVEEQKLELLTDTLKLALKLSTIYRVAHLAQFAEVTKNAK